MPELDNKLYAPFTQDQVAALNRFQQSGMMHPFTCPDHSDTSLVAVPQGWTCPHRGGFHPVDVLCDYTQNWAHKFMADPELFDGPNALTDFFNSQLHRRMGAAKMRAKSATDESRWSQEVITPAAQAIWDDSEKPWPVQSLIPAERFAVAALDAYRAQKIEEACEVMHDAYEQAAMGAGWVTNPLSRKPWAEVPEANKQTMRAAVSALFDHLSVL